MADKIKVLHVMKALNVGGTEQNLLNLAPAFDKERFDIHIAYSFGGDLAPGLAQAGAHLFKYSERDDKIKSLATVGIVRHIASYIKKNGIQIVHTHNFNAHVWGMLAAKLAGVKLVEHVHDYRYMESEEYRRRRGNIDQFRYGRFFKGHSDIVIVLTEGNREYLLRHRIASAGRIRRVPNGIPLPIAPHAEPSALRRELGLAANARVVFTPARASSEKNLELILKIAPGAAQKDPAVCFLIAGSGPSLEALKRECAAKKLDANVKFIGFRPDITGLLAISDVFLLPSFLELHSIAILEALKMSVPVVTSQGVGCVDEFIRHGENGLLYDPYSAEGWAEGIARLLADPSYQRQMGAAGRRTCEELFDIRSTAKKIGSIYEELAIR